MVKKKSVKMSEEENSRKLFAFLAVFLSIVGFVIAIIAKKEDKYVMYYAKQSLVLFIAWVIASLIALVPIIGWFGAPVLYVIVLILWIFALVHSLSGEMKPTPVIGHYGNAFRI
jgi:uncharacterized membrane protein